jgi:single-strand DNA-binding protein
LRKGDPVIVVGHVYTSEYEDRDGNRRSNLEMRATSVGPDLSRSIVRIIEKTGAARDAAAAADEPEVETESDGTTEDNEAVDDKALPLSA